MPDVNAIYIANPFHVDECVFYGRDGKCQKKGENIPRKNGEFCLCLEHAALVERVDPYKPSGYFPKGAPFIAS